MEGWIAAAFLWLAGGFILWWFFYDTMMAALLGQDKKFVIVATKVLFFAGLVLWPIVWGIWAVRGAMKGKA